MPDHTPGPLWPAAVVEPESLDDYGCYDICALGGMQIIGRAYSSVPPGINSPAEANARLWAAAPDLYEACVLAYIELAEGMMDHSPAVDAIKVALRKVDGTA